MTEGRWREAELPSVTPAMNRAVQTPDIATLTVDARRLWHGEAPWDGPLCFVDLDATTDVPGDPVLPSCPVVGLGDRGHPFARHLDAVIEPPVSARGVAGEVLAMPHAAGVIAQLLRVLRHSLGCLWAIRLPPGSMWPSVSASYLKAPRSPQER